MKRLTAVATGITVALLVVGPVSAAPNTATVALSDDTPSTGTTLYVTFEVFGTTPVVPYEYALQNTCAYPKGHFTLGQHDDIVYWSDTDTDGNPDVVMPVYLQSVPVGASCKVSLVRNNTVVKGSLASYSVGP